MALTKYEFSIANDFPNGKVATDALESEIFQSQITTALDHIDTLGDTCDIWFKAALSSVEETYLSNIVAAHQGEPLESYEQVEVVNKVVLAATNLHDKIEVHESSRTAHTTTYFTGAGDDITNLNDVGNGTRFILRHRIGDDFSQSIYIDFNIVENELWIHEGYAIWNNAMFDTVSFEIVPIVTSTTSGVNTNYNIYNGYLIVPAAGDGTIEITSDITDARGGLVYMPLSEAGIRGPAFWDATWNTTSKKYENITPAPNGDGDYNMFAVEVPLSRFVNKLPLLGNGFQKMQTADADQIGSGMRLKAWMQTYEPDHDWEMACLLTLYRNRTTSVV